MTPVQEALFQYAATRGASRCSDPATSRDAGRSMSGAHLKMQQGDVLRAARRVGGDFTAYEVWGELERTFTRRPDGSVVGPVKENVVSKRLGELRDLGLVELTGATRPGCSHRQQQVHRCTDAGREALT